MSHEADPAVRPGTGLLTPRVSFRSRLNLLGGAYLAALFVYVVVSHGMAPQTPMGEAGGQRRAVYGRAADHLEFLGNWAQRYIRGDNLFADPHVFAFTYTALILFISIAFVLLLILISRRAAELDGDDAAAVLRWSLAFAVLAPFASSVLVHDFWLSVGWGRLIADGGNPYYDPVTEGMVANVPYPPGDLELRMTYGPAWAVVAGATAAIAGRGALITAALFKLVLLAFWITALFAIRGLLRERPAHVQATGMAIAGWLPLSLMYTLGEGHNDIAMASLGLLWLLAHQRGRHVVGTVALSLSVLVKYMSAPLFLLDLLHLRWSRGLPWRRYIPNAAVALGVIVVCLLPFFRSADMFSEAVGMAGWQFLTPYDAVASVGRFLGAPPGLDSPAGVLVALCARAVQLLFVLALPLGLLRYATRRDERAFRVAAQAIVVAVLFGVVGHIWPWFLVWAVAFAAAEPESVPSRWMVGVALGASFPLLAWVVYPGSFAAGALPVLMYLGGVAWLVLAPRAWVRREHRTSPAAELAPSHATF